MILRRRLLEEDYSYDILSVTNYPYKGSRYIETLDKGIYQLECWGGQGGYRNSSKYGGKGGYSVGTLTLTDTTQLYIYVGGSGNTGGTSGGFNGGGSRSTYAGGGGASDIRIESSSMYARVIVAGGGGSDGSSNYEGGYGGGLIGGSATKGCGTGGEGGTQTSGYSFGNGGYGSAADNGYGGAGGGGWYGGTGTTPDYSGDDDKGGGGGSGYVYTADTASNYPSGCQLNSNYYLTNVETIAGNSAFLSTSGGIEVGHEGDGYIRITKISKNIIKKSRTIIFTNTETCIGSNDTITMHAVLSKGSGNITYFIVYSEYSSYVTINSSTGVLTPVNNIYRPMEITICGVEPGDNKYKYASSTYTLTIYNTLSGDYSGINNGYLLPGSYKLECWGAQGGNNDDIYGGKGGYSVGILTLTEPTQLYIYTGGQGSSSDTSGGGNGGGNGYGSGRGGGGASDIRIISSSIDKRIIVAGGGGGAGVSSNANLCGYGGGIVGGDGCDSGQYYEDTQYLRGYNRSGGPGSQTKPGISADGITNTAGGFGYGGSAVDVDDSGNPVYSAGGGGGGWYGGGAGCDWDPDSDGRNGGGGSGYIYTSATASYHPGNSGLGSKYYLTNAETIAGNVPFPSTTGGTEIGHSGNGLVRITKLTNVITKRSRTISFTNTETYVKHGDIINMHAVLSEGTGTIYYYVSDSDSKSYVSVNSSTGVATIIGNTSGSYTRNITITAYSVLDDNYYSTSASYTLILYCQGGGDYYSSGTSAILSPGTYKLECWGGQGGYRESSEYGGKGGYSVGTLTLSSMTTIYIHAGYSGNSGGYNGGGPRDTYAGGGGASDIRIGQDSLYARIIVAGGGGSDGAANKHGMYGGGLTGGSSTENFGTGGAGGTQTAGGTGSSSGTSGTYGEFGQGGQGYAASDGYAGAGGGGWYGGAGSYPDGSGDDDRGGGGGSGYVYTASTASNYPSGCLLNSSYYLTNAETITGDQSFPAPSGGTEVGHEGNGLVRITKLS